MRWPIRIRIALGTLLFAAVVCALGAAVLHGQLERVVREAEATLARQDLDAIAAQLGGRDPDRDGDHHRTEAIHPLRPGQPDALLLVIAPDGSERLATLPDSVRASLNVAEVRPDEVSEADGYAVVARTVTVAAGGPQQAGSWRMWAARSSAGGTLTLTTLTTALWIGAAALPLLIGLTAYLLAGLALRPVAAMRVTAARLARGEGVDDELLPVGPRRDELSALATTLNDLLERMRASAAREREMVATASHEIRTPIAVLTARLDLAGRHRGDAGELARDLAAAREAATHLEELTGNLLELSRLDAAHATRASATLAEVESETMAALDRGRLLAGTTGPDLDLELAIDHPDRTVDVGVGEVGRLWDNLIRNALAATPSGGEIRLRLRESDGHLVLAVTDTGRGIPEEFVAHAFERFRRPDDARVHSRGGAGLGLALVAAIAERAGGVASIGNRPEGGVRVAVEVPIRG